MLWVHQDNSNAGWTYNFRWLLE